MLRRVFERAGHEVIEAAHGEAALRCVWESPPDLVVTDLMMPVMDGLELIRRLRADPATAGIQILAVTGHSRRGTDEDVMVVLKPYNLSRLLEVAGELLSEERT